jgi:hypothetical protein
LKWRDFFYGGTMVTPLAGSFFPASLAGDGERVFFYPIERE